jgi:calcineurin-like phosphoesterase family protein
VKRRISDVKPIRLFAFYGNDAVAALGASETTEPSNLHLGHKNIIEHCDRPFDSVQEMNRTLIDDWNAVVDPDEVVFFLGDLGHFAKEDHLRQWLDELHGRVVFIEGNHDRPSRYVDGVNTHQYYFLEQGDRTFCCTHRPENQQANVSIELTGYKPIEVQKLIELIDSGE